MERARRVTRRALLGAAVGAAVVGTAGAGLGESIQMGHTRNPRSRERIDPRSLSSVRTREPVLSLTFDDGPDPDYTPAVLDILASFRVRATFFMIGRNVLAHPDLVREVVARGHQVANHTQDHRWLDEQPRSVVLGEVVQGARSLQRAGAPPNGLFRPPHGWTSRTVAEVTRRHGMRSIFWSDCVEKHTPLGAKVAAQITAAGARPGSILLTHDGGSLDGPHPQHEDRSASVAVLPHLLEAVLAKDLRFVTVSELTGV